MTGLDGDGYEMPSPILDDRALDALLSGARSSRSGFEWLVPFVDELAAASSGPAPDPQPALATILVNGFPAAAVDGTCPEARPESPPDTRRTRVGSVRPRLASGIAAWRTAVKLGMGLILGATGMTAAAAVGVLPASAQHLVASVVEAATPFSFPDTTKDKGDTGTTVGNPAGDRDTPRSDGKNTSPGTNGSGEAPSPKPSPVPASGPATTAVGQGPGGVGANDGATGTSRAGDTPASGHLPTGGPPVTAGAPDDPGAKGSNHLGTAGSTPAAGHVPPSPPGRR